MKKAQVIIYSIGSLGLLSTEIWEGGGGYLDSNKYAKIMQKDTNKYAKIMRKDKKNTPR